MIPEIYYKQWLREAAEREGVCIETIARRVAKFGLPRRRVNSCVIFVQENQPPPPDPRAPRPGEISFADWKRAEAARYGLTISAINMRLARGKYPGLRLRRVTRTFSCVQLGLGLGLDFPVPKGRVDL